MQTREEVLAFALSFPDTYQDAPFHDDNWQLVRVKGSRKAFIWTYERNGYMNLNVKVDPEWRDTGGMPSSRFYRGGIRTGSIGTRLS